MKDCPIFPEFRKVNLEDKAAYEQYYRQFEPYCDFSFNDLIIWLGYNNDLHVSTYEGNLIFRFSNPFADNELTYSVIGNNKCGETVKKIFELQKSQGLPVRLSMVPAVVVDNLADGEREEFDITEELDNRDYIFNVEEVHESKGKNFADLRHKLNYFRKTYPSVRVRELDLTSPTAKRLVLTNMRKWFVKRGPISGYGMVEGPAVERYVRYAEYLSPKCLGIFSGNRLIAFSIFHIPPQEGFAIGNHIKCDPEYRYLFDFTYSVTIDWLYEHGVEYVNGEQDLGLPGLRTHKQEMRPADYLERYTVMPKGQPHDSVIKEPAEKTQGALVRV